MAADQKLQYIIELLTQGDTTKAANELAKLDKASAKTATGMADVGRQFKAAFALIAGSALINDSINAFLEQERAIAKVNAALKSTAQFTPQLSKEMQDLATSLAEVSQFADEAILNVIAKLTAMGVRTADVKRVTTAILDLSTLMDRDLNRATLAMTQALNGNVEALRTIGLQLDDTKSKTDQFNDALGQIEKKAGGQAAEAVGTLGGKFELMKKQVGELKEAFGGLILNAIDPYTEKLTKLVKVVSEFLAANQKIIGAAQMAVDLASGMGLVKATLGGLGGGAKTIPTADLGPEATATLQKFFAAGGSAATPAGRGPSISTPGLSAADDVQRGAQLQRINDALVKSAGDRTKAEAETNKELERQANEIMQQIVAGDQMRVQLSDQLRLSSLSGLAREREQLAINHEQRVRQINATMFVSQQAYQQAIELEKRLTAAEETRFEREHSAAMDFQKDLQDLGDASMRAFSSGLATAIVDAFDEGDKAFQKFAANFFRQIAEMILQMLIFNALKAGSRALFGGGGQANAQAFGGVTFAAGGLQEVSSPTFFPKFNVIAGEAGREMLTVLARPRLETINGVPAQVGMAGRNRLAITSADALARGGAGASGRMVIEVKVASGLEARIVENAVEGAVVRMNQEAQENTTFSRTVRRLAS